MAESPSQQQQQQPHHQHDPQQQPPPRHPALHLQSLRMPSWVSFEPEYTPPTTGTANNNSSSISVSRSPNRLHHHGTTTTSSSSTSSSPRKSVGAHLPSPATASLYYVHRQESILILLCRQQKWLDVIQRCQQYPQEANPIPHTPNDENCASGLLVVVKPQHSPPSHSSWSNSTSWKPGYNNFSLEITRTQEQHRTSVTKTSEPTSIIICHDTALGLACRNSWTAGCERLAMAVIQALVEACPAQVNCHQLHAGHTPLRDALRNPTCCTPAIVKVLLDQMMMTTTTTTTTHGSSGDGDDDELLLLQQQPDRDGYLLLDHLLNLMHNHNHFACVSTLQAAAIMESLQLFLEYTSSSAAAVAEAVVVSQSLDDAWNQRSGQLVSVVSPLIRLLSQGTSLDQQLPDITCHQPTAMLTTTSPLGSSIINSTLRLERILQAIQLLLRYHPSLLYRPSKCTKCTVLHVALRNYGNFVPLIQLLLQADAQATHHNDGDSIRKRRHVVPLVLQRNEYGDLPLHVACAVGVPWNVLTMVVRETLRQEKVVSMGRPPPPPTTTTTLHQPSTDSLMTTCSSPQAIWSVNHGGYTPVDLEWVRHIEAGKGLLAAARSFYPLEASGIRKHCRKQDDFYRILLEDAVRQVVVDDDQNTAMQQQQQQQSMDWSSSDWDEAEDENAEDSHGDKVGDGQDAGAVNNTFGLLLHRIILLIQTAFRGTKTVGGTTTFHNADTTNNHPCLLHAVAALCRPMVAQVATGAATTTRTARVVVMGYSLPRPLVELFLWKCPKQIMEQDEYGRVPLHYAVATMTTSSSSSAITVTDTPCANHVAAALPCRRMTRILDDWMFACQSLIKRAPQSTKVADHKGRLPIHMALLPRGDNDDDDDDDNDKDVSTHRGANVETTGMTHQQQQQQQQARWSIVQSLVDCNPESVELPDPITGLFPFQLAAACSDVPLESVYILLKRSPSLVLTDTIK